MPDQHGARQQEQDSDCPFRIDRSPLEAEKSEVVENDSGDELR